MEKTQIETSEDQWTDVHKGRRDKGKTPMEVQPTEINTFTNKLEVLTTSTTISVNETAENVNSGIHTDSSQPITSKLEVSTTPNATSETTVNVDCVIHNLVTMSPSTPVTAGNDKGPITSPNTATPDANPLAQKVVNIDVRRREEKEKSSTVELHTPLRDDSSWCMEYNGSQCPSN